MSDEAQMDKRRRDLYAVSIGIILYNSANGVLLADTSVIFGGIHLYRPWVLLVGVWIVWAYFLWRFLLLAKGYWPRFLLDVDSEVQLSPGYSTFTKARLRATLSEIESRLAQIGAYTNTPGEFNALSRQAKHLEDALKLDSIHFRI